MLAVAKQATKYWLNLSFPQQLISIILLFSLISLPFIIVTAQTKQQLESQAKTPISKPTWLSSQEFLQQTKQSPQTILQVDLNYKEATKALIIKKISLKTGFAPTYPPIINGYTLSLKNNTGQVFSRVLFAINNVIQDPPPQPGEIATGGPAINTDYDFTITLPWDGQGNKIDITNPHGQTIIQKSTLGLPSPTNTPRFFSLPGDKAKPQSLLQQVMPQAQAQNFPTTLDVTFIGDNYADTEMSLFHQDVNRATTSLLTYEPFKTRASQITFHYIDNTTDLNCGHYYPSIPRLITCNESIVTQQVNNSGTPYDTIIVIVKDSQYGGSGGSISVTYNGQEEPEVAVHELGHTFGTLIDEYLLYGYNGAADNTPRKNCYAGTPPATAWINQAHPSQYYLECNYQNWYRPTYDSLMRSLRAHYFSVVSQKILNDRLDIFAGSFPDSTPPEAAIIAPTNGSTVSGTTTITTSAIDGYGAISKVELYKDGQLIQTFAAPPYTYSWDTTPEIQSTHTLSAKAYDPAGNTASSPLTTVTVNQNPSPSPSPSPSSLPSPNPSPLPSPLPSGSPNPNHLGPGELTNIQVTYEPVYDDNDNIIVSGPSVENLPSLVGEYDDVSGRVSFNFNKNVLNNKFVAYKELATRGTVDLKTGSGEYIASFCYRKNILGNSSTSYIYGAQCSTDPNIEAESHLYYKYSQYNFGIFTQVESLSLPFNKYDSPNFKPTNYYWKYEAGLLPSDVTILKMSFQPNTFITCASQTGYAGIYDSYQPQPNAQFFSLTNTYPNNPNYCWFETTNINLPFPDKKILAMVGPAPSPSPSPTSACNQADINKDGTVDTTDRSLLLADYFKTSPTNSRSDINNNGIVDLVDYSLLVKNFNQSTGLCQ